MLTLSTKFAGNLVWINLRTLEDEHSRRRNRHERSQLFRPPARAVHTLFHRDVGALQLLRNARAADLVHDLETRRWRTWFQRELRRRDLCDVCLVGLVSAVGWWLAG